MFSSLNHMDFKKKKKAKPVCFGGISTNSCCQESIAFPVWPQFLSRKFIVPFIIDFPLLDDKLTLSEGGGVLHLSYNPNLCLGICIWAAAHRKSGRESHGELLEVNASGR